MSDINSPLLSHFPSSNYSINGSLANPGFSKSHSFLGSFIVYFNDTKGNTLLCSRPTPPIPVPYLEYSAIPSSFHKSSVSSDWTLFSHENLYVITAFSTVDSIDAPRSVITASVGLVSNSIPFLLSQVPLLLPLSRRIARSLTSFLMSSDTCQSELENLQDHLQPPQSLFSLTSSLFSSVKVFGPKTTMLRKMLLCRLRIVFVLNSDKLLISELLKICLGIYLLSASSNPRVANLKFLGNICLPDINRISNLNSFICCTTEKLLKDVNFSSKFDVIVNVTPKKLSFNSSKSFNPTVSDELLFEFLTDCKYSSIFELNNDLFEIFESECVVSSDLPLYGLGKKDLQFVEDFVNVYDQDFQIIKKRCCCCC
ncbi:hypothetical protein GEMRC1_003462 [Eukaryota sp. GEM-RC1]